jgi:hypothetical protein
VMSLEMSVMGGISGGNGSNRRLYGPISRACNCRSFSGQLLPWVASPRPERRMLCASRTFDFRNIPLPPLAAFAA